jgi:hypothetical protein
MGADISEKEKFFSKERRIEENRNRLKELYEQYKKTENYYPLFLAYITAFGIYFFDFIVALLKYTCPWYFYVITIFTGVTFIFVLFLIWKFFKSVDWNYDYLPYGVYDEFPSEIINDKPELENDVNLLREELYDRYIKDLEDFVEKDLELYSTKRKRLKKVWLPMIISLLIYSTNIITYKFLSDNFKTDEPQKIIIMSPKKIVINESKHRISDSGENKRSQNSQVNRTGQQQGKVAPKTNSSKKSK